MLISVIYLERSFYVVVEEVLDEQVHDDRYLVTMPDFSQRGAYYHIKSYQMAATNGLVSLVLWHGEEARTIDPDRAQSPRDEVEQGQADWLDSYDHGAKAVAQPAHLNVKGGDHAYGQTYCVLAPTAADAPGAQPMHPVLFRFGNWCYSGALDCSALQPHLGNGVMHAVVPALQRRQGQLAYQCEASNLPDSDLFAAPLTEMCKVMNCIQEQITAAEATIAQWIQNGTAEAAHLNAWMDQDLGAAMPFFEFKVNDGKVYDGVELIAAKCYDGGVATLVIYYGSSYFVGLLETSGDQPLLDTYFPDFTDKGRGFHLNTYEAGIPGWEGLRKLTLWQSGASVKAMQVGVFV
jgi:hypothetical protein